MLSGAHVRMELRPCTAGTRENRRGPGLGARLANSKCRLLRWPLTFNVYLRAESQPHLLRFAVIDSALPVTEHSSQPRHFAIFSRLNVGTPESFPTREVSREISSKEGSCLALRRGIRRLGEETFVAFHVSPDENARVKSKKAIFGISAAAKDSNMKTIFKVKFHGKFPQKNGLAWLLNKLPTDLERKNSLTFPRFP